MSLFIGWDFWGLRLMGLGVRVIGVLGGQQQSIKYKEILVIILFNELQGMFLYLVHLLPLTPQIIKKHEIATQR